MHLIQLVVDLPAALDHAEQAEGLGRQARRDTGLVVKTLLTGAFAGPIVRPWRLHATHGRAVLVLGYADEDARALNARLAMALPSVQAAVGEIVASPTPTLGEGETFAFELRVSPVVSVNREDGGKGLVRRDAFLRAKELAEKRGDAVPTRDDVYRAFLAERLAGFELVSAVLAGHRLARHAREGGGWTVKSVPEADLKGLVRVREPEAAVRTLRDGVGRSKAYGCGMLRLAPASAARAAA